MAELVDIHCHLLPGLDDGAAGWDESLAMARAAVDDGIGTIIATPHQLGNPEHVCGEVIRSGTGQLQRLVARHGLPLRVLPGADVRIEPGMVQQLCDGEVLSLGDHRRHVLLELPHELFFPIDTVLAQLRGRGFVGILSHPERNAGIQNEPGIVRRLVEAGCLMQLTAASITGGFGQGIERFSRQLLKQGLVHFVATDAHGMKSRRPLMRRAYERIRRLVGSELAEELCRTNPAAVAEGRDVAPGPRTVGRSGLADWLGLKRAG